MTTDGPAALRRLVEDLRDSDSPLSRTQATIYTDDMAKLRDLAAAWDAERAQAAADRAALEQTRAQLAGCLTAAEGHISPDVIATPGMYGWSPAYQAVLDTRVKLEEAYKALAQARALMAELEWFGVDGWLECPWCLGTKVEHYGEPAGHKPDCKLAALLGQGAR